jgi:ATP-dependent DNA helicase RecG
MTTQNLTLPTIESEHVEFKVSFSDEVIITLVAFSNSKGGTFLYRHNRSGSGKGFRLGKETIAQWINEIKIKPFRYSFLISKK